MTKTEQTGQSADERIVAVLEANEGQRASVKLVGADERVTGKLKRVADKDGEQRFQIGRRIASVSTITDVEVEQPVEQPVADPARAAVESAVATVQARQGQPVEPEPEPVKTTLTSGKVATGRTMTIRCAWVAPENRTKKQQELFDSGFEGVEKGKSYEAMVKAAGNGAKKDAAMPDGTERVIKVQDAFQVRFSPENQKRHRNELRRQKAKARRAAREAVAA